MIVYAGDRYTATVDGSTYKKVVCEKCGRVYYYQMARQGTGEGQSPFFLDNQGAADRARERANRDLQRRLAKGCEPVACPDCGWFQTQMVRTIRRRRFDFLYWIILGVPLVALLGTVFYFGAKDIRPYEAPALFATLTLGSFAFAIAGCLFHRKLWFRYDPNALKPGDPDPAPNAPHALELLNDPVDFEAGNRRLRFSRAWASSTARRQAVK